MRWRKDNPDALWCNALTFFQGEILAEIRDLILQCDQTMRTVTVAYFQLQHTVTAPLPVQVRYQGEEI